MSVSPSALRQPNEAPEIALLRRRLAESEAERRALARRLALVDHWRPLTDVLRRLTPSELRLAELVATGSKNHEIADELFLSSKTVEWHLSKLYRKLNVRSRTELVAKLVRHRATSSRENSR
jgi:DNA-binding NarL/FixJ family response regulator